MTDSEKTNVKGLASPAFRVCVHKMKGNVSKTGNMYRFRIRVEGDNVSSLPLGWSGVTINVPTVNSREQYSASGIQMSSVGCNTPSKYGPGDEIWGFRADGTFGKKAASCLSMECVRENWPPRERIALEVVVVTSCKSLDAHVRVWSTRPDTKDGFGDPDWKAATLKDQQGISSYPLSLRLGKVREWIWSLLGTTCDRCGRWTRMTVLSPAWANMPACTILCPACLASLQSEEEAKRQEEETRRRAEADAKRQAEENRRQVEAEVSTLLAKHSNVNEAVIAASYGGDFRGPEPLQCEVVQALLERGGHVNARGKNGQTPLLVAAWYSNLGLSKVLVANGADVNAVSADGTTALLQISERGSSEELARFLLDNGADPNARTKHGFTPLMFWAKFRNTSGICRALLDRGADVNARNDGGRDPLMFASEHGDKELLNLLRSRGATGGAQAEAEAARRKEEAEIAQAREAHAKRERDERAEARRLEGEAVAKGDLLPRPPENEPIGDKIEGTFRAAGLTWQLKPAPEPMILEEAESYAATLKFGGASWRLPTVQELDSLYKAKSSLPAIAAYLGKDAGWHWSGSPYPKGNTWCANLSDGSTAGNVNDKPIAVRCVVRTKQADPAPRRTPSADQSEETFRAAGLTWQKEPARWEMNWEDAKSYASRLTLAGGGWRLPAVHELHALYKEKLASPAVAAYPGMDKGRYWSGTPDPVDPTNYICALRFEDGNQYGVGDICTESVRCVRE